MKQVNRNEIILNIGRKMGVFTPSDVENADVPREYLYRLFRSGKVEKIGRGMYGLPGSNISEHHSLIEVAKKIPGSVISLISALHFHNLTTQLPNEVWVTLEKSSWTPKIDYPPINFTFVSGKAFSHGVQKHIIDGIPVKVYSPAKTVADCFKFRNKIGLDVAIEALKESWRENKVTMDEIAKASKVCRVSNIIRPYLEAIV